MLAILAGCKIPPNPDAALTRHVYTHRLCAGSARMVAAMDGFAVLVFTGGVGENAPESRARTATGLGVVDVGLDSSRNERAMRWRSETPSLSGSIISSATTDHEPRLLPLANFFLLPAAASRAVRAVLEAEAPSR